mmetsp:Transcript_1913/g.3537  ORF Transcript_1913/g.3537 Transcript_1913/m.3537 type:complete len:295 (+) Transcript_1913:757-1641(+)
MLSYPATVLRRALDANSTGEKEKCVTRTGSELVHICLDLSPCGSDAIPQHGGYHHVLAGGVAAQRTHVVFFKLLGDVQPKVVNVGDVGPYWHVVAQVTTPLIVRENQQVILTPCGVPVWPGVQNVRSEEGGPGLDMSSAFREALIPQWNEEIVCVSSVCSIVGTVHDALHDVRLRLVRVGEPLRHVVSIVLPVHAPRVVIGLGGQSELCRSEDARYVINVYSWLDIILRQVALGHGKAHGARLTPRPRIAIADSAYTSASTEAVVDTVCLDWDLASVSPIAIKAFAHRDVLLRI